MQVMWRYTILYMTERCYESGGLLWDQVFNHVCWCLFIFEFFTGALMPSSKLHSTCNTCVTCLPSHHATTCTMLRTNAPFLPVLPILRLQLQIRQVLSSQGEALME